MSDSSRIKSLWNVYKDKRKTDSKIFTKYTFFLMHSPYKIWRIMCTKLTQLPLHFTLSTRVRRDVTFAFVATTAT